MAATTATANTFLQRLIGAAACDTAIYEEVEADERATAQAIVAVVLSSLAAGIGASGWGRLSLASVPLVAMVALLLWAGWALLTFEIGKRLMPDPQTRVDVGQMLRTIGFATAPGLLRVFGAMPAITAPVFAITTIWMLATMVVAVRQALDYRSTARAIGVCVVGWTLAVLVAAVLGLVFTPPVQ
jgi:hypothetical protein